MKYRLFLLLLICFSSFQIFAKNIQFNELPVHLQLYPRDSQDSSLVLISGVVADTSCDSITVEIFRGDQLFYRQSSLLNFIDSTATFSFQPKIFAELSEYFFSVFLDTEKVAQVDSVVCGDVYFINGQSNALAIDYEGKATFQSEWFRSFGNSSQTAAACRDDLNWGLAQATTYYAHAAVGVWGLRIGQLLVENFQIPICILNGATGGSYIADHLRKDSSPTDLNTNYGKLLYRTRKAKVQQAVKGIFWNQGEMNTNSSWSEYATQFDQLYNDWKLDYTSVEKIYIFQIRPCNSESANNLLREVQRQIAENYFDVDIMSTAGIPGQDGVHYNYEGYSTMGLWLYRLIARDFYNSADTLFITPPKIESAHFFSGDVSDMILLQFDQSIVWPQDTLGASMKNYFFLNGDNITKIDSGFVLGDTVFLRLSAATTATGISYLPNKFYSGTINIYEGPWLRNLRSVGALAFFNYPVLVSSVPAEKKPAAISQSAALEANYPNPFNAATVIRYSTNLPGHIKIAIYNLSGQVVETLQNKMQQPGNFTLQWQPKNLSSGIYWCRLSFDEHFIGKQKLVYLK